MPIQLDVFESAPMSDAAPVLVRAHGLAKRFGGQQVLSSVTLTLRRGETVLLRGDNGAGKTTLLNILSGHLAADNGVLELHTNGSIEVFQFPRTVSQELNPWSHFTPERTARHGVSRTWQDIRLFGSQTLLENVAVAHHQPLGESPLSIFTRPGATRRERQQVIRAAEGVIAAVGLSGREHSSADMVSLGQAKRVAIARAIDAGASVLLLDEPLAGLDAAGAADVISLLRQLVTERGIALVLIEHVLNIPKLMPIADAVWTLQNGVLHVERFHGATRAGARSQRAPSSNRVSLVEHVASLVSAPCQIVTRDLDSGARLTLLRRSPASPVVLDVRGLRVRRGYRHLFGDADDGFQCTLQRGDLMFLEAPNGWGKTTLLEALAGLLPVDGGSIRLSGQSIDRFAPWKRARLGVALVQARQNTFGSLTVEEALRLCGASRDPEILQSLHGRRCADLSGGERQKVALACAHATPRCVYLYDEPLSALDEQSVEAFLDALASDRDRTAVVALPRGVA